MQNGDIFMFLPHQVLLNLVFFVIPNGWQVDSLQSRMPVLRSTVMSSEKKINYPKKAEIKRLTDFYYTEHGFRKDIITTAVIRRILHFR